MLGIKEIPANKSCTNVPQEWHKLTKMASENYIQSLANFMMLEEET